MNEIFSQLPTLPQYLSGHLLLSFFAMIIGISISIPLGVAATRRPRLEQYVLGGVGVVQTIPSLALLALMVPILGGTIGWKPALIALSLYSMLPILTNTITGLKEVDRRIVEAGRAVGMTEYQLLRKVMIPLSLPVIVAGIRTSVIWVVGTATLATPVGGDSLGYYIFVGLNTRNTPVIIMGCLFSALLAMSLDWIIAGIEVSLRERIPNRGKWLTGLLVGLVCAGIAAPYIQRHFRHQLEVVQPTADDGMLVPTSLKGQRVIIGGKNFTEQYLLVEVLKRHLESKGMVVDAKTGLGSKVVYDSTAASTMDIYIEYSGTLWATVMKREDTLSPQTTLIKAAAFALENHGIHTVGALGFENAYAFAMTKERAGELGVSSIEDLARVSQNLSIAGDFDFFGRAEGRYVLEAYGLQFNERRNMSSRLMYDAIASGAVDVVTAYTSDGQIAAFDLVVLEDPKGAFPPYDAMLMASPKAAKNLVLMRELRKFVNQIDNEAMRKANKAVDIDGKSVAAAAAELYESLEIE